MITKVCNLIFAGFGSLVSVSGLAHDSTGWDPMSFLIALVTFCWLVSAIGLFFRSRLALCGSLLGAGVMLSGSTTMFVAGIKSLPAAQDPTDGIGYSIVMGFIGLMFSIPLLIGLVRLRRRSFPPAAAAQPSASGNFRPAAHLTGL